jgi:predicted membrane protein
MGYAGASDLWAVGCSKVFAVGFKNKNLYISFSNAMYENIPTVKQQILMFGSTFSVIK